MSKTSNTHPHQVWHPKVNVLTAETLPPGVPVIDGMKETHCKHSHNTQENKANNNFAENTLPSNNLTSVPSSISERSNDTQYNQGFQKSFLLEIISSLYPVLQ